jgi:hypothetical protein
MKSIIFFAIINLVGNFLSNAQSPHPFNIAWQRTYGGSQLEDNDYLSNTMAATPDGGYILTGDTWSNDGDVSGNHGMQDAWVCKIDGLGNRQWQKCIGGSDIEYGQHIINTLDGGYLVGGSTNSNDGDIAGHHGNSTSDLVSKYDIFLAKLDNTGKTQWIKTIGGSKYEDCGKFIQNPDGTYMFIGLTESNDGDVSGNHGKKDVWLVKLDERGNIIWQKCYGGTGDDGGDHQTQIIRSREGGYLMISMSNSTDGQVTGFHGKPGHLLNSTPSDIADAWFVKIDENGVIQWQKCFGGPSWDFIENTFQLNDGSYIASGGTHGVGGDIPGNNGVTGQADWWLLKISQGGNLIWSRNYGGTGAEAIHGRVFQLTNGDLIIPSGTRSNDHDCIGLVGLPDLWIAKTDPVGNILSYNIFGSLGYENLSFAVINNDGSITVAAMTDPTEINNSGHDANGQIWILKLTPDLSDTFAITTTSLSQNVACPGYMPFTMNTSFVKRGTFNEGNIFTAELSDANGSFAFPVAVGTLNSSTSGTISCNIPGGLPPGGYYSVRIKSSSPQFTGITSGHLLNVQACASPSELTIANLSSTGVQLQWSQVSCAIQYKLQYSKSPNASWSNANTINTTTTSASITGLNPSSTYFWRVTTKCSNSPNVWSAISVTKSFTTLSSPLILSVDSKSLCLHNELIPKNLLINPNPVSHLTTISFSCTKTGKVFIGVYDIEGRLISILLDKKMNIGLNHLSWNVENIKAGTYFLKIESENYSDTRKIIVVK